MGRGGEKEGREGEGEGDGEKGRRGGEGREGTACLPVQCETRYAHHLRYSSVSFLQCFSYAQLSMRNVSTRYSIFFSLQVVSQCSHSTAVFTTRRVLPLASFKVC